MLFPHSKNRPVVASPEKPTGNCYDAMFGSDDEDGSDDEETRKPVSKATAENENPNTTTNNNDDDDDEQLEDHFGDNEEAQAKEKVLLSRTRNSVHRLRPSVTPLPTNPSASSKSHSHNIPAPMSTATPNCT